MNNHASKNSYVDHHICCGFTGSGLRNKMVADNQCMLVICHRYNITRTKSGILPKNALIKYWSNVSFFGAVSNEE